MTISNESNYLPSEIVEDIIEWEIMHGVAFKQHDSTARHVPFSIAPMKMKRNHFEHLLKVTPLVSKLINNISEDHAFLQSSLSKVAEAEPFFKILLSLHKEAHGEDGLSSFSARKPLLIMRTDFMDDREQGAKVIEFNGIAAGMAPFGSRGTQLHRYICEQHNSAYQKWLETDEATVAENEGLEQVAIGIAVSAIEIKKDFGESGSPTFLMVVQESEDNVYDQHLLELELQKLGFRTVRRTFEQLSSQLSTGQSKRLILENVGPIDVVYLRTGYQCSDYYSPKLDKLVCCQTLSRVRLFIERHHVAMNATISQQLATSKAMQMLVTNMSIDEYMNWGLTYEEALLVKSVLADMNPIRKEIIKWFNSEANKEDWVLKNQGEGGGNCVFGADISQKLELIKPQEYDAWALMQRIYAIEREKPVLTIRDGKQAIVNHLISEIGLFTVYYNGEPVTEYGGYAGYLIRSKPANENEGGIHSGQGLLDSLMLI
ncbi:glutathione synthase [Pseudoalteromonas sp. JBTF-M23]|uniref:glutathione synthase n=1 Tax=Pseudoalteromonas caenipelagi TaxID=2726988 RepID=A0A849VEW2_9GAMM|nr:glutathione synthase [Pseudoalteromonas caenipelagi]NOU51922.1 glutathione synthase [Pseudoalteromonas caenipelagi]